MIKISNRLKKISEFIDDNCNIIDIGCDHGLLSIYLMQNKNNIKVIASDVNENALSNAIDNIKRYKVNNIETRLGNGLDIVDKNEIDTIIISGMGAHTIVSILYNNLDKLANVDSMIIQSNNNHDFLREKITKIGYFIEDEALVEEKDIIYTIIKFRKGRVKYSKKEVLLGPMLMKEKSMLFEKKCKMEKDKLELVLKLVPKNKVLYRYKIKKKIKLFENI